MSRAIVVRDVGQPSWFVRLLIALILACGVGCISYPVPHATVASTFTPDEQEALGRAAAKWNTIVREPVSLEGGTWQIVKSTPPDYATKGYVGETLRDPHVIFIMPGLAPDLFYAIALHEMGHMIGLHHIAGPGVMSPSVRADAIDFTEGDLEECRTVGACPLSPLDEAKCRAQGACGDFPKGNP